MDSPHPLSPLSESEFRKARDIILDLHGPDASIFFRSIFLQEPRKSDLIPYLEAEHSNTLDGVVKRPPRQALVDHDIIQPTTHKNIRAVVNIESGDIASSEPAEQNSKSYYTQYESQSPSHEMS